MQKFCILFCTVASIFMFTSTFPLGEKELDDLIHNLQDIRRQYEMENISPRDNQGHPGLKNASSKYSQNLGLDSDKKSLLYDYYANTMGPVYSKRSFMPVHGKRNSGAAFREVERIEAQPQNKDKAPKTIYGSFSKGSFNDEADQYGFDNFYKRNFEDFGSYN